MEAAVLIKKGLSLVVVQTSGIAGCIFADRFLLD